MNGLRGVQMSTALEGTTMALCELARAASRGNTDSASLEIISNVLHFYEAFPQPVIKGLVVVDTGPGGTVQ
jgi:hypothetical protein